MSDKAEVNRHIENLDARAMARELKKLSDKVEALEIEMRAFLPDDTTPQPDRDGWIPHDGGECPVEPSSMVECQLRGGLAPRIEQAGWMRWAHLDDAGDIVAYRPVKQEAEPDSESAFLYLPEEKEFIRFVGGNVRTPPHIVYGKWYEVSNRLREERLGVMFYNERGLEIYPSGPGWDIASFRGPYFVEQRTDSKIDSFGDEGWWMGPCILES